MAPSAIVPHSGIDHKPCAWKSRTTTQVPSSKMPTAKAVEIIPRTIDELIRQGSADCPNDPILSYPSSGIDYVDYSFRQLDAFAYRVAQRYKYIIPQRSSSFGQEVAVVGLLGPSNLEYLVSLLALTKLGHTVLFLSTRISVAAYGSLLKTTGAVHIIVDPSFRNTAEKVKEELPVLAVHNIADVTTFGSPLSRVDEDTRLDRHLDLELESYKVAWIIHSSGSTGLPKPIFQTHSAALNNYASNLNLRGFITLPLYHAHGISSVFRALYSRKQIYIFNASLPLTQKHLLGIMQLYNFEIFYGVPYALKVLGESPEGIAALAKLQVVMFGGSACPDALGDRLVDHGVNLISHYGTTETGQLMTSFRSPGDKAWDYVRVPKSIEKYIRWEMRSPGIYELVVLDGLPSKVASNRPDGSYATKDLFMPHSSMPNAWRYFARLDDTIVLMNGEKVTPTLFEQLIRDNKYVKEGVLFGSGKTRLGMIIIPSHAASELSNEEVKTLLAPVIAKANEEMPAYAQLTLDMVEIVAVGTDYPCTDKGTAIRAAFYHAFKAQIEAIYETAEVSNGSLCLSEIELRGFIRRELAKILAAATSHILEDDTDFFSVGVDSLQAIQLRSIISKNIQTNIKKLSSNLVFEFPTISSLARELYRLRVGGSSTVVSTTDKMEELITKYSSFEPHISIENTREGHYVVVTGATGSLGAHLVSQLILRPDVTRVYCLVRAKSASSARIRVIRSLRERCVYHYLPLDARKKIVAVPADFSKKKVGIDPHLYSIITSEITALMHCAWSVNFNLGLGSFETDCIAGTHSLLSLCLKAQRPEPASFNFCSSVSAVARTKGGFVPEALPENLECAQDMGYAQSKLVTENICIGAAKSYGIKARVLRVGQVIADSVHGIWNATEAIPLILQAGQTIGAIPKLDENPLWLPVNVVASTIVDISLSNCATGVMNVVNHKSFHWTRDLLPAVRKAGLEFAELEPSDWVKALRMSNPNPIINPPIKLLEFFASKYENPTTKAGLTYDTSFARFLSPSLAAAPVINQEMVSLFIKQFRATSWASTSSPGPASRVIVVAGPCGAGKSFIAKAISDTYAIPVIEGDHLHSKESIDKMASGVPLSDDDRWLWLETVKATALVELRRTKTTNIVVTCSALKRVYRNELRGSRVLQTVFLMLQGSPEILRERVGSRGGHFMGAEMVESQLESLEAPGLNETDVIPIDVTGSKDEVLGKVLDVLKPS